ncbi:hypothetical protein ACS0TY_020737 [Phlomoides rotata]
MYLVNIHDFGHSKEQTPLMLIGSTSLESLPQSVPLHQDFEKSQNYQIRFLMPSTSLNIITLILKEVKYPSFHFMKLRRPDKKAFTYIKEQETKPALVVNLTEDEISTRRALGVWVCLTEMDKVKYPFKIYQNYVNGPFLLNTMTGATTRSANDTFEQKRAMI